MAESVKPEVMAVIYAKRKAYTDELQSTSKKLADLKRTEQLYESIVQMCKNKIEELNEIINVLE